MMGGQRQENLVDQDDVFEVVDDGFSVKVVHCGGQPVPVQTLRRTQLAGAARDAGNGNDLLEGDDLNDRHDADDVDVAHEEGGQEAGHHDKGPEGPGNEVGLLLLILGAFLVFGGFMLAEQYVMLALEHFWSQSRKTSKKGRQ